MDPVRDLLRHVAVPLPVVQQRVREQERRAEQEESARDLQEAVFVCALQAPVLAGRHQPVLRVVRFRLVAVGRG